MSRAAAHRAGSGLVSRVVLLRHAEPLVKGICCGWSDIPVPPFAEAAVTVLSRLDGELRFARIVASPLERCHGLAREIAARARVPIAVEPRIREFGFGEWEGRPWSEIEAIDAEALKRWMRNWETEAPPGGETLVAFESRVSTWWCELDAREPALVVTHAGVIRALRVLVSERTWPEALREPVPYLAPSLVGVA